MVVSQHPPNNTLTISVVAITSVGTIYCNSNIKLNDVIEIEKAKQLYQQLSISEADVSYRHESGTVTIR